MKASDQERKKIIREIEALAKKAGKRVFGYASTRKANCQERPNSGVPESWDRICVEGDSTWTYLPLEAD